MDFIKLIGASWIAIPLTAAAIDLPPGSELFLSEGIERPMTVKIENYTFTLEHFKQGIIVKGMLSGEEKIRHTIEDAGFDDTERLFALLSRGCGGKSVDLVLQLGPGNYGDVMVRSYYRIVFSRDLKSVISEFGDPSVFAVNAVLPIQSVEGIPSPKNGQKVTCQGSVPTVKRER